MAFIDTLRAAAQQALEVLEAGPDVDPIFAGETEAALRAALAEPVQEPVSVTDLQQALIETNLIDPDAIDDPEGYDDGSTVAQIDALHELLFQRPAEPVQEPGFWGRVAARQASRIKQLETAAQQAGVMLKTGMPEYNTDDVLEVLEAALEALEAVTTARCGGDDGMDISPINAAFDKAESAREALKAALAEPVQEPDHTYKLIGCVQHDCEECQRRTQRPAEPVGIVSSLVKGGVVWQRWPADMPDGTRLFGEVQP